MGDLPVDFYQNRGTLDHLKSIAAGIFARYGIDFTTAERLKGWSNVTWLAGGMVLRLSGRQGDNRLRREVQLASLLPPEVGYPPVLESAVTDGYEWCLSKEVRGKNLGEIWPTLDWDGRTEALRQLWEKILAVHTVGIAAAAGLARQQAWFNAADAAEAEASMRGLVQQNILTASQVDVLGEALRRFWETLPTATRVLNHGDLTIENALWHADQVVSLLDFEFAVIAPAELDLNELVKCAFAPNESIDPLPDPGGAGLRRMRQVVADLARPVLAHPGGKDLLVGYAILLELWMIEEWLEHPEGEGPIEQWQPYRMLVSLADGHHGYLAPILA